MLAPRLTSVCRYSSLRDTWLRGLIDVGEHHRRPAEHVVFEHDAGVDRHVVLDLDVVADHAPAARSRRSGRCCSRGRSARRPSRARSARSWCRRRSRSRRRCSRIRARSSRPWRAQRSRPRPSDAAATPPPTPACCRMRCDSAIDRTAVVDAEAAAGEHFLVDAGVQVGEPVAELDLVAVDRDRSERRLHARLRRKRQVGDVRRQEPAHPRALELEEAADAALARAGAPRTRSTGPNSHSSRSKKWMPMLVTMPPERSSEPFHDTSYQRPRAVT